jgi:hypothetical protein
MSKPTDTKRRHLAATEARVHFGELVDDVADGHKIAEVERSDGYTVLIEPTGKPETEDSGFDAQAWIANLRQIHERMRAYRAEHPITEMPEDILRDFYDNR